MMPDPDPSPSAGRRNWNSPEARDEAERAGTLELSRRLEALAQLSSEVAHDVNNALQVIRNAVELLRRRLPSAEADVAGLVDMLARNSERAASLMQRLSAFSRSLPPELRTGGKTTGTDATGRLTGLRVLVVEGESHLGQPVEDLLDQLGCRKAGPVSSVEKALEIVASGQIDLALLDGDLGGERVYKVAETLQAQGIPFVFMSGPAGIAKPWRSGAVIQKPFELAQFRSVIQAALGGGP